MESLFLCLLDAFRLMFILFFVCMLSHTVPTGHVHHVPFRCDLALIHLAEATAWESCCSPLLYHTERGRAEQLELSNKISSEMCLIYDGEVRSPLFKSCVVLNVCITGTIAQQLEGVILWFAYNCDAAPFQAYFNWAIFIPPIFNIRIVTVVLL